MKHAIINFLTTISLGIVLFTSVACSHNAPIRVVVVGEDSDVASINRSHEIYKRVVAQIQEALIKDKIFVVDEDMLAVKLGFTYNENRTKQELLETLMIANDTTDATVKSRLGVIFSIFPNIQEMTTVRKLTVRVRGQIYDLKSLRALSSFEVSNPEAIVIPKKESMCNNNCVIEKAGEVAGDVARELGAVLSRKLHKITDSSNNTSNSATNVDSNENNGSVGLDNIYTVKFKYMKNSVVMRAVKNIENKVVKQIELIKSSETVRIYSVTTTKGLGDLEEKIMMILLDLNVNIDDLRFKAFGTELVIESL